MDIIFLFLESTDVLVYNNILILLWNNSKKRQYHVMLIKEAKYTKIINMVAMKGSQVECTSFVHINYFTITKQRTYMKPYCVNYLFFFFC